MHDSKALVRFFDNIHIFTVIVPHEGKPKTAIFRDILIGNVVFILIDSLKGFILNYSRTNIR